MNPVLLHGYQPTADRFDEFIAADGSIRPGWQTIAEHLQNIGSLGLQERSATIEQLIRDNGITVHDDSEHERHNRPWQLSAIPLVIDSQTWLALETGLTQRTELLEAVLDDLLGPQRLVKERVIPAEILWANPYFHRNYHGLPSASGRRLHVTATDLARGNDGSWWVTGDRTRAPSGLGYLLENRIVTNRVFPQLIRQCNTRRLAAFFDTLRNHLRSLAPRRSENPRVVLLTPGAESYRDFEDAYLARYLGLTLVQGTDLAVRSGQLNLKTLGGLLPIEVLWRHISDRKCDPLELDPDSNEGVTGLLRVIRQQSVEVVNSIGSVMVQVPALLPFLPAASELLFSRPMSLPSVATYWCGQPNERQYVLDHLDELMIRPAFAVVGTPPVIPAELSKAARAELIAEINAKPQQYVAQQRLPHSTTPVWRDGRLEPWHVAVRCFQLQTSRGIEVLPGAMARLSPVETELVCSAVSGQLTQDCWVSSNQPVDNEKTLLTSLDAKIELKRSGNELPSRVAEHLFWLGRYAERGEAIARLLRATLIRLSGENDSAELAELPRLAAALAAVGQIEPAYAVAPLDGPLPKLETILPQSVLDAEQPRGLFKTLRSVVANATAVRDRLSIDAYRILQHAAGELTSPTVDRNAGQMIERLNRLISDLLAFSGIASESTTRTHAWRFLLLGRRIERADQTAELLSATLVQSVAVERPLLEAVLDTSDSLMTYRSRYLNLVRVAPALDLLVTDESNPRALRFQLDEIMRLLVELPTDSRAVGLGADEKLASELSHQLRMADPDGLSQVDSQGKRPQLEDLLTRMIEGLPRLSDAIAARYLIHTSATQTLTGVTAAPLP